MKIKREENFRVVIYPRNLGDYGFVCTNMFHREKSPQEIAKEWRERCEKIESDVRRHVNYVGSVHVECDTTEICSHCGRDWDVSLDDSDPDYPKGTPLCCNRAAEEFKEQNTKGT